ncbi:MAG: hypothetical protein NTW21_41860 [Verrucomicrobia bacterium]|nr:hypothetical protein [Verrucomicrobiota bacterium]
MLDPRGIRKRCGGVVAPDGVDFDLRAGEIHALTTLLRHATALVTP